MKGQLVQPLHGKRIPPSKFTDISVHRNCIDPAALPIMYVGQVVIGSRWGCYCTFTSSQTATSFAFPGTTPSISANRTVNALVWAAENGSVAVLHAYDASNLTRELYNSNQAAAGRDQFGTGNKFIVPTIANGKVYVGTTNGVGVFGLLH